MRQVAIEMSEEAAAVLEDCAEHQVHGWQEAKHPGWLAMWKRKYLEQALYALRAAKPDVGNGDD